MLFAADVKGFIVTGRMRTPGACFDTGHSAVCFHLLGGHRQSPKLVRTELNYQSAAKLGVPFHLQEGEF